MPRKKTVVDETQSQSGRLGEFGSAIAQIADEKGIDKEKVIETVEAALAAAYKKDYGKKGQHIRAEFSAVSGDAKFFKLMEVVDENSRDFSFLEEQAEEEDSVKEKNKPALEVKTEEEIEEERLPRFNAERDMTLEEAVKIKADAKVGDVLEIALESKSDYGRVAAQTAKQVIIQKIREAEREAMFREYKEKEGQIVNGIVQKIEGRTVFVDLGKSVGCLPISEQIDREKYRIGQRLKVYISKVESDTRGPGITLSRTSAEIVKKLFELEVPEIFSGTVEIKSIAREAGSRTKLAVTSKEEGLDPIGSCVGQKGTRVQSVIDELGGEKIDIVPWNEDPEKFISSSLSPAKVLAVKILSAENRESQVIVPQEQLSLAIGKQGQNVRLAVKLTGWKIDVVGSEESGEYASEENENGEEAVSAETKNVKEEKPEENQSEE